MVEVIGVGSLAEVDRDTGGVRGVYAGANHHRLAGDEALASAH
jgi:hypothetical protein